MSAHHRSGPRDVVVALGRWTAPRKWRLVGVMLGLLAYGGLWILYAAGATMVFSILVIGPTIVVLVGAGNLLQGWLGISHRAPQFAQRAHLDEHEADPTEP